MFLAFLTVPGVVVIEDFMCVKVVQTRVYI